MKNFGLLISTIMIMISHAMSQNVKTIILDTPSELVQIKVMMKAGSAYDPPGFEGLASLTARMLLEGSYGDARKPVTKEMLADILRPWGSAAKPSALVEKETATFSFAVPVEVFGEYASKVMRPLFNQPLFADGELQRIKRETETMINSTLRLENTELLGLYALDNFIHEGTQYAHLPVGSMRGLKAITRTDLQRFYKTYYTPGNVVVVVNSKRKEILDLIQQTFKEIGKETSVGKSVV